MIVGVFANPAYVGLGDLLERLTRSANQHGLTLLPERALTSQWPVDGEPLDLEASLPDMMMCFGGDGTLLRTARAVGSREIPILGVKVGRVGFLTGVTPETLDAAVAALEAGKYSVDRRRTLHASILGHDDSVRSEGTALNDVVVHKAGVARVIRLRVTMGEEEIGMFSSDGLIVATPTGSTAYSLSAGGPILLPGVEALVVTPISPHTLAVRPIVVPGDAPISIEVPPPRGEEEVLVSYDGQVGEALAGGERVLVTRTSYCVGLVRLESEGFFTRLRRQLQWGDLTDRERT